jgi:hypothetical protein
VSYVLPVCQVQHLIAFSRDAPLLSLIDALCIDFLVEFGTFPGYRSANVPSANAS